MPVLETVLMMKQKGYADPEIISMLREQGISPKDINDAISQAKVKRAVDFEAASEEMQQGMQPSMLESQEAQMPIPQPMQQPAQFPAQPAPTQPAEEQYMYPTAQAYPAEYGYEYAPQYQQQAMGIETINEIAEQIVAEKISEADKKISTLSDFRKIAEARIENINERLRKIESTIENLQLSVLNKISSYGTTLQDIKTEMQSMQNTFSKTLNPLMDRQRETREKSKKLK